MGTASSSTASPTVAGQNENAYISTQPHRVTVSKDPNMALAYNSQITHQDDTLMNLQELDSHLAIFEESADSGQGSATPEAESRDNPPHTSIPPSMVDPTKKTDDTALEPSRSTVTPASEHDIRESSTPKMNNAMQASQHARPFVNEVVQIKVESMGSSMSSLMTDRSEFSSALSSASSKATSPTDFERSRETTQASSQPAKSDVIPRRFSDVKAKSSIPSDLEQHEYARQCIVAAESSRLNPFGLHPGEYALLRTHLNQSHITTYLNIRNGILRLWVRNPQIAVSKEEAIGCARESRWFDVAYVCYEWLVRHGYINFGCFQLCQDRRRHPRTAREKRLKIVIIGAGVAGLTCARQLEGLCAQYEDKFRDKGQLLPEVTILEGRDRIGGRVYSRPLKTVPNLTSLKKGSRCTAEMGGMIIIGFERGNPLNVLVRNQLALPYNALIPELTLYDTNGQPVNEDRDKLNEGLHNYTLERVSKFKFKLPPPLTIEGNKDSINAGRDIPGDNGPSMSATENPILFDKVEASGETSTHTGISASSDRVTGRAHIEPGPLEKQTAGLWARLNGWPLKSGVQDGDDINLEIAAAAEGATLGSVMDEVIEQFKSFAHVLPMDYRLQSWHSANLEYANAQSLRNLSLPGWDADAGNEWEGAHSMIIGGYQQVPRGLMRCPYPLNIQKKSVVTRITCGNGTSPVEIELENGISVDADHVVCTVPLGVLKSRTIEFNPPLPDWKLGAIDRMGFGVLNKVILVFREQFWSQDFFGILRDPVNKASLDIKDYTLKRGRFFQFVNCTASSGLPVLAALMAGETALEIENEPDHVLIAEAAAILRNVFGEKMSEPVEAIVTRWGSDRFTRGSYSSAGPRLQVDDYDQMAKRVNDNLFFAGEHTSATHPATVHGAILSGQRAATELFETIVGSINIPEPLLPPKESKGLKRKASSITQEQDPRARRLAAYDAEVYSAITARLGVRPVPPAKVATAGLQLYTKDSYEATKKRMETARRGRGKVGPNDVRGAISKAWKATLTDAERKPYIDRAQMQKKDYDGQFKEYLNKATRWEHDAYEFKQAYEAAHPSVPGPDETAEATPSPLRRARKAKRVDDYAEHSDPDIV